MSVRSAYKALMDEGATSKHDVIMQGMCKEWIWEFLLRHCCNSRLLRALAVAYPIPDSSLHLKRLLLLKSLSFDLTENRFTDRTVETMSALSCIYHSEGPCIQFRVPVTDSNGNSFLYQFSLWMLYLAVRVECTIQYLRPESDDWPKFYESLERHWGDFAQDTEEPEPKCDDENADNDTYVQLKEELWAVLKQPELRHDLLKKRKREYVIRMMQSFLADTWENVGVVFLEGVAQNVKEGLYVPDGFALNGDQSTREGVLEAGKPALAEPVDAPMAAPLCEGIQKPHGSAFGAQTETSEVGKNVLLPHDSLLPQDTTNLYTLKQGHDGPSKPILGTNQKDLGKEPSLSSRPIAESVFNINDARSSLSNMMKTNEDQKDSLLPRKRKMPASLQKEKAGLMLPSYRTDDLQADKAQRSIVTRSSSLVDKDILARDTVNVDESPPQGKGKDNFSDDAGRTQWSMGKKQRGEGIHHPEEEHACLSPPPWTGSPGLNEIITVRKRPTRAPLPFDIDRTVDATRGRESLNTPVILKAQTELKDGQANLNAAVQDPLPEAMKIAEEAAKISGIIRQAHEPTFAANDMNQGMQPSSENLNINTAQERGGGMQGPNETNMMKSIMDWNPTARTIEWETSDDIADSSDDRSPSRSRHVCLPKIRTRQSSAYVGGKPVRNEPRRRKFKRWSIEEENVLRKEVERYGKGVWKHILQKHKDIFEGRTEVDLKDKWRNIERREGLS